MTQVEKIETIKNMKLDTKEVYIRRKSNGEVVSAYVVYDTTTNTMISGKHHKHMFNAMIEKMDWEKKIDEINEMLS